MDSADRVDHLPTGNQIESVFATIQVCRHSPILKGQGLTDQPPAAGPVRMLVHGRA